MSRKIYCENCHKWSKMIHEGQCKCGHINKAYCNRCQDWSTSLFLGQCQCGLTNDNTLQLGKYNLTFGDDQTIIEWTYKKVEPMNVLEYVMTNDIEIEDPIKFQQSQLYKDIKAGKYTYEFDKQGSLVIPGLQWNITLDRIKKLLTFL